MCQLLYKSLNLVIFYCLRFLSYWNINIIWCIIYWIYRLTHHYTIICPAAVLFEQQKCIDMHQFLLVTVTDSISLFTMTSQYRTLGFHFCRQVMACFVGFWRGLISWYFSSIFDGFYTAQYTYIAMEYKMSLYLANLAFLPIPKPLTNKYVGGHVHVCCSTRTHYPDSEQKLSLPLLLMLCTQLGSSKYQI